MECGHYAVNKEPSTSKVNGCERVAQLTDTAMRGNWEYHSNVARWEPPAGLGHTVPGR